MQFEKRQKRSLRDQISLNLVIATIPALSTTQFCSSLDPWLFSAVCFLMFHTSLFNITGGAQENNCCFALVISEMSFCIMGNVIMCAGPNRLSDDDSSSKFKSYSVRSEIFVTSLEYGIDASLQFAL